MMARRFSEHVNLGSPEGPGWAFLRRLEDFASQRIPDGRVQFYASLPGSYVSEETLDRLREEVEDESLIRRVAAEWGDAGEPLYIRYSFNSSPEGTVEYASLDGEDQAAVLGAAEVIRRNAERWATETLKEDSPAGVLPAGFQLSIPDGAPQVQIGRRGWRRVAMNPWVVTIAGGLVVAGLWAWLS